MGSQIMEQLNILHYLTIEIAEMVIVPILHYK